MKQSSLWAIVFSILKDLFSWPSLRVPSSFFPPLPLNHAGGLDRLEWRLSSCSARPSENGGIPHTTGCNVPQAALWPSGRPATVVLPRRIKEQQNLPPAVSKGTLPGAANALAKIPPGISVLGLKQRHDAAYNLLLGNWGEPELHLVWYEHAFAPFGELKASGGEVLVLDGDAPPTIEVREKGTGSWTALSPPDIAARWTEGEIYLSQALLDTLPQAWELRAAGKVYRQSGNCRARQANELASAIDALDKPWVSAGTPGGAADAVGGSMQARIVAQTSESCSAGGVVFDGWGMGQTRGFFAPEVGDLLAAGAAFPYWRTPTEWRAIVGSGVMSYTPAHVTEWFQCTSGGYNRSGWYTPSQRAVIHTAGTPGAQNMYFGEDVLSEPGWPYAGGPAFNIQGVPWNLRGFIARLYDGAEIIEAKVPVRMQGLRVRNWSFEHTWQVNRLKGAAVPNAYESRKLWINGELHKEYLREDGVVVTDEVHPVDMWKTEEPVAFALVGRREHVQQVYLPLHHGGRWADQPVWQYRSFGSGLTTSSTASDGKWRMVDCRSLIQDALRARSSRYTETYLWPTNVGAMGDGSTGALTTYLRNLESSVTFNASLSGNIWTLSQSRSGQYTEFDGVQFGEVLVRFRLPGGLVDEQMVPIVRRG